MKNETQEAGFDLNKVYTKIYTKKELIKLLKRTFDKEFIVSFLPRTKDNSDFLIRSTEEQLKKSNDRKNS